MGGGKTLRVSVDKTIPAVHLNSIFLSPDSAGTFSASARVPHTFRRRIEVCVRRLLSRGPVTYLCHILLSLINADDTISYTLSPAINGNYAMLFNCRC